MEKEKENRLFNGVGWWKIWRASFRYFSTLALFMVK
jgi:hypothetical protein